MRQLRYSGTETLVVPAAHSRRIAPGMVVDVDEIIVPRQGAVYTLAVALGADLAQFTPVASEPMGDTAAVKRRGRR